MAKLTEDMVVARTRASDLSAIKKLNCWGGELQDISLLRRMNNVEVLSLSVNRISSLADVQYCKNLRELYVRKNEIKNLNEICYLKNLPYLKALWLGENPCSASDSYRMTVIKNLPTLEKLDDVKIEPEERQDSMKKGRELIHPEDSDYENNSPTHSPVRVLRSPPASGRSSDQDCEDSESRKSYSPEYDHPTYTPTQESKYPQGNSDRRPESKSNNHKNSRRTSEIFYDQDRAYRQYDSYRIEGERYSKPSPYPPRRPVTRNSNLLSAVLCLIKELDYPSLEVVAIAVRCRMDEFDD